MTLSVCDAGIEYWTRLRGERSVPRRDQFDPIDIPALLPNIVFLEVIDGGQDFRFRVIGQEVRGYFFENYTGRLMSSLPHVEPEGPLFTKLRSVVSGQQPVRRPVAYVGPFKDIRKQDEVVLPLVDETGAVSHLLIFLEFMATR